MELQEGVGGGEEVTRASGGTAAGEAPWAAESNNSNNQTIKYDIITGVSGGW